MNGDSWGSTTTDELLIDLDSPLMIGASSDLYAGFIGSIDEVAIYGHALDPATVTEHYKTGVAP